ncbi:unnamed protein product [Paramecium primaurelia]|uniref:Uncharacterized protein n=1 Tax=Paramecium primaurelia TaxID=5886 RepID=A0A8S1P8G7_PARPR|nr:unnamed protein product [Paramecium primaurelia]
MLRSALYEIAHDYIIQGEDSLQNQETENYQPNRIPLSTKQENVVDPFQNFSNLLQAQKQKKQIRRALISIDTNFNTLSGSPEKNQNVANCSSKHQSTYSSPKNFVFYDRQIRWLNQVKQTIKVKEVIQQQRQSVECPFKPKKCPTSLPQTTKNQNNKPTKMRKDSYSTIHLLKQKFY